KLRLPTLNDTKMVLKLTDRTISKPTGVAENVFVKVGKFYFPADFVILDFVADLRVPLILGRPFLSTAHAIINVFEREIIIRHNQQSLTIQCSDIPSTEQINKIEFINEGGIDSESEEIEDFLNDDSIQFGVEDSLFNMDKDILFLESLLRDDPIPPHPIIPNQTKLPIKEINHSLKMGYEHFNTNLLTKDVAESSTKNLIPIPNECIVVSENGSQSSETINDNFLDFMAISNPLFDEFYGPSIPIHIIEEERTRREHADYINQMEMLFTINPRPYNLTNDNTNVESFSSFQIPNQESEPRQEEIDVVSETNDVLPPSNDDSDDEVNVVGNLRVDNVIQDSEHEYSESENSVLDNPLLPLPPPEPPDKEFDFDIDFEKEISVMRNLIVKPFIPIHILEEERIRREHADYINRMEMLFTINPRRHNPTNDNTNVESFSSFLIPIQESDPHQEEINVVSVTNDVLPPSDDDLDEEEVDAIDVLRVDNFIQNSEHEYSESEDSDFDNPLLPLPHSEPPDKGFDIEIKISVVRNVIVKFECIDAKVKFDVFNDEKDDLSYFMLVIFAKMFSLLSIENEDTIFDPGISD
nr:reverse transcriptase domain-containing protein [Tanacetum cinerariifolium]